MHDRKTMAEVEFPMRVIFVGVGEAFDETLSNTSVLVESGGLAILLDCGFTAASSFWAVAERPLELDMLYISHFHGDHYFGIPALLGRSIEEGRSKPLTIMGQSGVAGKIRQLMDMAYPNSLKKAQFALNFIECQPETPATVDRMQFRFAVNDHPMPCLSIRIESEGKSIFYSGDGKPTKETQALAQGCDLIIHESFFLEPTKPGHGTVDSSIEFAREAQAAHLALVHVQRTVRRENKQTIITRGTKETQLHVFLPEPGDRFDV
ncbi:MAG: ribonuclease Z [Pseudodesulfovibrio sp.]